MGNFGEVLKNLRVSAGMSQQQLAEEINVSNSVIRYYERSERAPSVEMLIKLSDIFNVSTDHLLGIDNEVQFINVSDLTAEDIELLRSMIIALRKNNGPEPAKKLKVD